MFELICDPERIIIGNEVDVVFKISDEFNRKNYVGKYIYLSTRKNGSSYSFDSNIQRYNGQDLFWTINKYDYEIDGTFLIEARTSAHNTQSSTSKIISSSSFIVDKKISEQFIEKNNITSIQNKQNQKKTHKYNTPHENLERTESVINKVTLNIKPLKISKQDQIEEKVPVYTNVTISKGKNVGSS